MAILYLFIFFVLVSVIGAFAYAPTIPNLKGRYCIWFWTSMSSFLGSLISLYAVAATPISHGPTAPLAGLVIFVGLFFLIVFSLCFYKTFFTPPPWKEYSLNNKILSIAFYFITLFIVYLLSYAVPEIKKMSRTKHVEVSVLDSRTSMGISHVHITFQDHLTDAVETRCETDKSGGAKIFTLIDTTYITLSKEGYRDVFVWLTSASDNNYGVWVSWIDHDGNVTPYHFFYKPHTKDSRQITIYMAGENEIDNFPYNFGILKMKGNLFKSLFDERSYFDANQLDGSELDDNIQKRLKIYQQRSHIIHSRILGKKKAVRFYDEKLPLKEHIEKGIFALCDVEGKENLANKFANSFSDYFVGIEWRQRNRKAIDFAQEYIVKNPKTPIRSYLTLFLIYRYRILLIEEKNNSETSTFKEKYLSLLSAAYSNPDVLVRLIAEDIEKAQDRDILMTRAFF